MARNLFAGNSKNIVSNMNFAKNRYLYILALTPLILCSAGRFTGNYSDCGHVWGDLNTKEYSQWSCKESYKKWSLAALELLDILDPGMNETTRGSTKIEHAPETTLTYADWYDIRRTLFFFKKSSSAVKCRLFSNTFLSTKNEIRHQGFYWVRAEKERKGTYITLTYDSLRFPVKMNPDIKRHVPPCPVSTESYYCRYFWGGHEGYANSLFANFSDEEIPGMQEILAVIKERAEKTGNLNSDISRWNMAIAIFPLVLTVIPVSGVQEVNDFYMIIYVLVTDIMATFPLLLKGIELWVEIHTRPPLARGNTFRIARGDYYIVESYTIKCGYTGRLKLELAHGLVFIALWIMAAAIYVEFLFWRWRRLGQIEALLVEDENNSNGDSTETTQGVANNSDGDNTGPVYENNLDDDATVPTQENENNLDTGNTEPTRVRYFESATLFVMVFMVGTAVPYVYTYFSLWNGTYYVERNSVEDRPHISQATLPHIFPLFFFWLPFLVAYAFGLRKANPSHYMSWFLCMFAGTKSPLSVGLVLNTILIIHVSDIWNNAGFFENPGMLFAALVPSIIYTDNPSFSFLPYGRFFTSICVVLAIGSQIARSKKEERVYSKYYLMGGMLGLLFGPFGFLFMRVFPENQTNEVISLRIKHGCVYGTAFCLLNIVHLFGLSTKYGYPNIWLTEERLLEWDPTLW